MGINSVGVQNSRTDPLLRRGTVRQDVDGVHALPALQGGGDLLKSVTGRVQNDNLPALTRRAINKSLISGNPAINEHNLRPRGRGLRRQRRHQIRGQAAFMGLRRLRGRFGGRLRGVRAFHHRCDQRGVQHDALFQRVCQGVHRQGRRRSVFLATSGGGAFGRTHGAISRSTVPRHPRDFDLVLPEWGEPHVRHVSIKTAVHARIR